MSALVLCLGYLIPDPRRYFGGLLQNCRISIVLTMKIPQCCMEPSDIYCGSGGFLSHKYLLIVYFNLHIIVCLYFAHFANPRFLMQICVLCGNIWHCLASRDEILMCPGFNIKTIFLDIGIPIVKIRWSWNGNSYTSETAWLYWKWVIWSRPILCDVSVLVQSRWVEKKLWGSNHGCLVTLAWWGCPSWEANFLGPFYYLG